MEKEVDGGKKIFKHLENPRVLIESGMGFVPRYKYIFNDCFNLSPV